MPGPRVVLLACVAWLCGCSGGAGGRPATPASAAQRDAAAPAVAALQDGRFDRARVLSTEGLAADAANPYLRLVRALARYEASTRQLALDGVTLAAGGIAGGALNEKYLRQTFTDAEGELAGIEGDLSRAAERPGVSLELCPACWEIDWNGDGAVDARDRLLLQIEQDDAGRPIPEGDPRRKPTFRLDDGDVAWARAFVSFERAGLDLLLAYDWTPLGGLARHRHGLPDRIVVRLVDPGRVGAARQRILEGLDLSDACRRAYLAETDDDREWVPSPVQRSHPLPLRVDAALYATWEGVVGDLRRLVAGQEGLALADLVTLSGERLKETPTGALDLGQMLAHPKDLVIDVRDLQRLAEAGDVERALSSLLGDGYRRGMAPSPLPRRLLRMKGEVDRQEESFEHKLRYLLWFN